MSRLVLLLLACAVGSSAQGQSPSESFLDGLRFRSIGPATMSGRVVDLAVSENDPYVFYVASATGGIWKTTNNGVTFEPQFQNEAVHSIGAIALHAKADSVLWVGTGERANRQSSSWGNGVYRSTDGGKTFTHLGLDETRHIGRIALHPEDPDIAYVAGMGHLWGPNDERGLYKTTDGGQTWERVLHIDEDTGVVDVALDPSAPNTLYAATYQRRRRAFGFDGGGPGSGLHKSNDGGATWKRLTEGLPEGDYGRIGISIFRGDPRIVYASVEQGWQYNASTAYGERRAGVYRSEDRGESWTFMSDWNPRPMYASQPYVDPSDDQRIYMQNSFSWSDDGGKTFTRARQSLHGDDRIVWVNPNDSRHVIKGDDGGVGISYDRARTWLYVTSLPISQFYRVDVDMQTPYWVYGGLQDNGSWAAPNETYRARGILNEDWVKTGGGDGFVNHPYGPDPNLLYTESQYLGLSVLNRETGERRDIRPGDPQGRIGARRNWDSWGPGEPEPFLGNAMAPANWDGPFVLSAHDPNTVYAGTNIFWKSTDGGDSWQARGDLTTRTDRRGLKIMGQAAHDSTLSLDDGIPYWPTISAIAESPVRPGLLYAGTDDGLLHVSKDDGNTWDDVTGRLPGAPEGLWVAGIEPSRTGDGSRVYVAINNYRNDDYANYLYISNDAGQTWDRIGQDLPEGRVLRTIKEDPRNPHVLYLGAEIGLFVSVDGGRAWSEWNSNLPTAAFNDLVIHPRDNDLIVATHGRGIWVLDDLGPLQQMGGTQESQLFQPQDATMTRIRSERGHAGDMIFYGENPERGAVISYYLSEAEQSGQVAIRVLDAGGALVRELTPDTTEGLHRMVWDLRHERLSALPADTTGGRESGAGSGPQGPLVMPGIYQVEMQVGPNPPQKANLRVVEDPRLQISVSERANWTESLFRIADLYEAILEDARIAMPVHWAAANLKDDHKLPEKPLTELEETHRLYSELISRVRTLYGQVENWTGPMTADQEAQLAFYGEASQTLADRVVELREQWLPQINRKLPRDKRIRLD